MLIPNRSFLVVTDTFFQLSAPSTSIHNYLLATTIDSTDCSILMATSSSSSSSSVAVAAATVTVATVSAVMGLLAGYYYRSVTSVSHRELKTLKVPAALLNSPYGEELKVAVQLAMEGAHVRVCAMMQEKSRRRRRATLF